MTLGFSQKIKINGILKDTFFREKILVCLCGWASSLVPKKHSIRQDKKDRWKIGHLIHFVYGNRTKKRECFHIFKVISIEYIAIVYPPCCGFTVYVFDPVTQFGVKLNDDQVFQLALNDGFDTVEDFKAYFHEDFKGKLIHWTDLKYAK